MKIAICQVNPVIGDFEYNISLIKDASDRAKDSGCLLVVFPGMSLMGCPPKDLLERSSFTEENIARFNELASRIHDIAILLGHVYENPLKTGKPLINGAALIRDGRMVARGGKRLFADHDACDETRYLEPPAESLIFDMGGKRFGVTVSMFEDTWSPDDFLSVPGHGAEPVYGFVGSGIDVLINISASPFTKNIGASRLNILRRISREYHVPTIYCNQVGGNDGLLFDGSSMVVDQDGRLICIGRQFEPDLSVWDTDEGYDEITNPWVSDEESILSGLIMGMRDYAAKCGFSKVLLGLSGGLDSSLVAFIAREAMGPENVTGVSMPSPYTSEMSKEDARTLAGNLGIRFEEIPINELIETCNRALAGLFAGLEQDETEENIQARVRGNILMAMSNKFKALLLATGNKSELAMGYCTLYGDMCGGLAVIGDVSKTFCYGLCNYINRNGEIIPERIISRPPSAELRLDQTDQDSLPPYDILDDILEAVLERNLGVDEIVEQGHDPAVVKDVLHRLSFNEYKRQQAPPCLRITTRPFGYGRQYPIARGGQVY